MLDLHPASDDRYRPVCRPLKRPRVGHGPSHRRPQDGHARTLCGMMDAPCNGCWKAPRPSGWGRNKAIRPHWSPPLGAVPSPRPMPSPRPLPSPGQLTPASQRSPPSWAGTPVRRPTPSPQYSPTRSAQPLNQDELRRQIDLSTQDQQQRYQKPVHPSGDPYQYHHHRL